MRCGKVSIIVPIYKVEKYIHRCIESILHQTYSNLEIILIDDGSPDNCGEIVDQYAEQDDRIKVLHKKNGGLSDARNHGMKLVTGEFTMFVDSDDWLETLMIERQVNYCVKYRADAVQSAFYYAYDDLLLYDNRHYEQGDNHIVLDNKTLMYELVINEKVKNFAWGKLYRTVLIKDIPFKEAVLFEDVFWAHQVMHHITTYVMIHQPLYYYYQRDDSIVANYTPRNLDIIKGLKERHSFLEKYHSDLKNESYKVITKTCLIHYNLLLINWKKDKQGVHRKEIRYYIHNNYQVLKEAVKDDNKLLKQFSLFSVHPILNIMYLGMKKGLRKIQFGAKPAGLERMNL
ncbi:glycosyltransferase [Aquibacillus halophilus]|uniref:Glycosyltransferase n=1 Tax=Aquibacillus halophilus TaxID=930132 RepID=A0A6A8DAR4_9BACI|nr:glycosyltransferase family 2 protein [Aquibacillus halophilus]MRH42698.1 glycosyltransferase [Aquibacillus halophilus]